MPHQNRVTPYGDLIADPARGTLFGNRGLLHDANGQMQRHHRGRRWICCLLHFKGRRRPLLTPGHYTELFFLDEATALAAGHRPCVECRRADFSRFRTAFVAGNAPLLGGETHPKVDQIDTILHAARLTAADGKKVIEAQWANLPDGAFVEWERQPWLVWGQALHPWFPAGYGMPEPRPVAGLVMVLTPWPIVTALQAGYRPAVHKSVGAVVAE